MSARHVAAALLAMIILVIQFGVPAAALLESRPVLFGWQMYSTLNPAPEASIEDASGDLIPVELDGLIADPRAEIRWSAPLSDLLCRDSGTVTVVVTDREGTTIVRCP